MGRSHDTEALPRFWIVLKTRQAITATTRQVLLAVSWAANGGGNRKRRVILSQRGCKSQLGPKSTATDGGRP